MGGATQLLVAKVFQDDDYHALSFSFTGVDLMAKHASAFPASDRLVKLLVW